MKKPKHFIWLLCMLFILTGCSALSPTEKEMAAGNSEYTAIGNRLEIRNIDSRLTLQDNMDALSADGLYYAAWSLGEAAPYENSDGDSIDLYDAQLYLLLGEFQSQETAQENMDTWLSAARTNYQVTEEETIVCGEQSYTVITYDCISESNPYARGVSAFGAFYDNAVCLELTCQEEFSEDLETILINFLNCCSYRADEM